MTVSGQATVLWQRKGDTGSRGASFRGAPDWDNVASDFYFMHGGDNELYYDVVWYDSTYWTPNGVSGTKSTLGTPSASNTKWKQYDYDEFIASKSIITDAINMVDSETGEVIFSAAGGEVNCKRGTFENVTVSGKITAGTAGGRRVELDPDTDELNIYDSDGSECTKFEGNERTESELIPSTSSTTFSLNSTNKSRSFTSALSQSTEAGITSAGTYLSKSGAVTIEGSISASLGFLSITTDNSKPYAVPSVQVSVILRKYTDSNYTTIEKSIYMGSIGDAGVDAYSDSRTISVKRIVDAGYYKIFGVFICEKGGSKGFTASGSWSVTSATFTSDSWQSRHFKNGLCLSKNNENYFLALLNSSGYMDVKAVSNGNKFIVKSDGIYAQTNDMTAAGRVPILCFHGIANYASDSYSWSTSKSVYGSFSIAYSSKGVAVITMSSNYKFTLANTIFNVVALGTISGGTNHNKASIKSITTNTNNYITAVTVWLADDTSTNDGNFIFDVYRI